MHTMAVPSWQHVEYPQEDWIVANDYQQFFQPHPHGLMGPFIPGGDHRPVNMMQVGEPRTRRLGREQWPFLEEQYAREPKPTTKTKQGFADMLGVDIAKINNWFQNRRAKTKQEKKKVAKELLGVHLPDDDQESAEDLEVSNHQGEPQQNECALPYRSLPQDDAPAPADANRPAEQTVSSMTTARPFYSASSYPSSTEDFDSSNAQQPLGDLSQSASMPSSAVLEMPPNPYTPTQNFSQHENSVIHASHNLIELPSNMFTSAPQFSHHEALAPVQMSTAMIELPSNAFMSAQPFSPNDTTFQQSVPSSATHSPGEWSSYNTVSSPTQEYNSDTTLTSEPGMHAHDIFGSPITGPWTFNDFSVQNSPAVGTFPENCMGVSAVNNMIMPNSYLSPPISREMNNSTVSLSALDTYQMPPPENAALIKPRQNSQPSLAERRRKAGPSSIRVGSGANLRTASYTAGMMPMTPRSPSFVDQTLRKVRSNGNGAGRIQKPSTPGIASPGLGSFANFQLDTSTPPPSAPPTEQKFSLMPTLEYPAPIRPLPVTAQFETLAWNGPMSAPPTQQAFAFSVHEGPSPGSLLRTTPSPLS